MESFNWEKQFETGQDLIDKQHKTLFGLVKKLATAWINKDEREILNSILFELEDYTRNHFKDEEELLKSVNGFPSSKHQNEHHQFIEKLRDLKFSYVSDNKVISYELFDYLNHWLRDHILGTDKLELRKIQT